MKKIVALVLATTVTLSSFVNVFAWGTGTNGHDGTHEFIVNTAVNILRNDMPKDFDETFKDLIENLDTVLYGADLPDTGEKDGNTMKGHFYKPYTKTDNGNIVLETSKPGVNYLGDTDPTAKTRFLSHAMAAKSAYNTGSIKNAMTHLGMAMHYLSDMTEAHHAQNQIIGLSDHLEYEGWVDTHKEGYVATTTAKYNYYTGGGNSFDSICEALANDSAFCGVKEQCSSLGGLKDWPGATYRTLETAEEHVAVFLYAFFQPKYIVLLTDTTSSMAPYINNVKEIEKQIVDALPPNSHVAIADYRDFPQYPYGASCDYPYRAVQPFTNDKNLMISGINSLTIGNGEDGPESVFSGLMNAINGNGIGEWRKNSQKVVILMGDAPPHDPEPISGYTFASVTDAANQKGISSSSMLSLLSVAKMESIYPSVKLLSASDTSVTNTVYDESGTKDSGTENSVCPPVQIFSIAVGSNKNTIDYFSRLASETKGKAFTAASNKDAVEALLNAIGYISGTATTPEPTATPTPSPIHELKVLTMNPQYDRVKINTLFPWYRIYNTSDRPINLSEIKVRYYFTSDDDRKQICVCDWANIGKDNIISRFVKLDKPLTNADCYAELGFNEKAGVLAPGAFAEIQTRLIKEGWTDYDQTNDYSLNKSNDYKEWQKATAYVDDKIVWGEEPK